MAEWQERTDVLRAKYVGVAQCGDASGGVVKGGGVLGQGVGDWWCTGLRGGCCTVVIKRETCQ